MWAVAAFLAVLAVAVPMHRTISADGPTFDIDVPMTNTTVDYETAKAQFTISNLPSTTNDSNWIVSIKWKTASDPYGDSKTAVGSGVDYTPSEGYEFDAELSGTGENRTITAEGVALKKLIPDSDYTFKVKLYEKRGNTWFSPRTWESSEETFTTKSGCYQEQPGYDADSDTAHGRKSATRFEPKWFGGGGHFTEVGETTLTQHVFINRNVADENSGRCLYYSYSGSDGSRGSGSVYVRYMHGSGRRAVVAVSGLSPGTRYSFNLSFHPQRQDGNVGTQGTTLGPNTGISGIEISNLTQDSADATATVENASTDDKFVYIRLRTSPEEGEAGYWINQDPMSTKTATATFDLESLSAGTRYEVEASVRDYFPSGMSHSVHFVTLPGKPTIDSVSAGDGQLTVNWTAPAADPAPLTGYRVQWQQSEEKYSSAYPPTTDTLGHHDVDVDDTSYTITGLTNGKEYAVNVIAKNESFDDYGGTASNEAHATPMGLPNAPNSLQVAPGNEKLTLIWEAPTVQEGVTLNGYKVQWKANTVTDWDAQTGVTEVSVGANVLTHEITGLDNSTTYDVRVRADNGVSSDNYSWANGTGTTLPDTPENLEVASGNGQLTVTWDEPDEIGNVAITGYVVQYRKTSENSWTTSSAAVQDETDSQTNITTYNTTISSLDSSTEYDVRVRAQNSVTLQDEDNYNWAEDDGQTIPDSPGNLQVAPGDAKLTLTWEAPPPSGSININGFIVQHKKAADSSWDSLTLSAGTLERTISNLDNGDLYSVRVRAVNTAVLDDEDDYNWAEGDGTPRPDPIVTGITVPDSTKTQTSAIATVTIDNETDESQTVHLQYRKNTESGWTVETPKTAESTDTSVDFDLRPLIGNTTYVVEAWLAATEDTKESVEFTTAPVKPDPPTNVRVTDTGDEKITVAWDVPSDGGSPITGYKVQWKLTSQDNWDTYTEREDPDDQSPYTIENENLENGERYDIQVVAANDVGDSDPSGEVEGVPSAPPDPPTSVQVSDHGDKWLEVTWTEPTDKGGLPTTYIVQWKWGDDDFSTSNQATPVTSPHKITNLKNGRLYAVRVLAENDRGKSGTSNTDTGTPMTKPQPPTGVNIKEYGNEFLKVGWTAPEESGGSDLTEFKVQWKENTVSNWDSPYEKTVTAVSEQTDYETTMSSLANGTKYNVRVLAVNGNTNTDDNTSKTSNIASGTPSTNPLAPTAVTITNVGDRTLTVSWEPPTNNGGSAITNYKVQWQGDGESTWTTTTTEKGAADRQNVITELTNGTMYTVQVFARNANGLSSEYGEVTGKPVANPKAPPKVDISDYGNKWLEVTWDAVTDTDTDINTGGSPIKNYIVQWKSGSDGYNTIDQAAPSTSPHRITNLKNGTEYTVRVLTVNEAYPNDPSDDPGDGSNEDSETPRTIPEAPTDLEVISGDEEFTVSWTAPTDENNGGATIKRFIVQWKTGSDNYNTTDQATPTDTTQVIDELRNGTPYSIRVRADNGETAAIYKWVETTGTPLTVPGVPTNLRAEEGNEQLDVSWVASKDTGGTDIEKFVVQWKPETVNNWDSPDEHTTKYKAERTTEFTTRNETEPIEYTIEDLDNGVMYDVRVRADNSVEGQAFQWAYTTGKPRTIPGAPRSLRVTAGDGQLSLSWAAPSDNGGLNISQYFVQWQSGNQQYDTTRQATTTGLSHTIRPLVNGTLYTVRVRADNTVEAASYNWAQGSKTPAATTNPPPPPPVQNPPAVLTPSISSVSVDNITKTTARAVVKIDNHDGTKLTVELRYQVKAKVQDWETDVGTAQAISNTSPATKPLESLPKGTKYVLQASFDDTFPDDATEEYTFTTLPSILSVSVDNVGRTSARATINIANSDGSQQIAKLQFREKDANPVEEWNTRPVETAEPTTGATALIDLSGLTADTRYDVQAWLASDETDKKTAVFGTSQAQQQQRSPSPIISNLKFENIGQTSATAMVGIDNAGTDMKDVYLKHSIHGTDEWAMLPTPTPTYGDSTSIDLGGLQEKTTYEVAVALSDDFDGMVMGTFTTLVGRSLSGVTINDITQTSAVATVSIANSGTTVEKTVYLRHREFGESGWGTAQTMATTGASAAFDLTGLTPRTMYKVQASFSNNFTGTVTATFTTLAPDPSLSRVTVKDIKQTTATAEISIADPGEGSHTVRLRYRTTTPQGAWSGTQTVNNSTVIYGVTLSDGEIKTIVMGISRISMSGLTTDTEYEVQASLDSSFASIVSATFITLRHPSLSAIDVTDITKTSATAEIDIADPDGTEQTTHLRYRTTTPQGDWSGTLTTTSATAEASIDLSGLTTDTEYEVEASLTSDFAVTVSDTFTTLPADPVVSKVDVSRIRQTTATADINIANSNGTEQIVHLHYRTTTPRGDWSETLMTSTADSASIDLSGLTPDTEYEVQASLDSAFTYAVSATFTTLRYPSLIDINVTDITKTTATSEVYIADPDGTSQTVHLRYRTTMPQGAWSGTQTADSVEVTIVRELSNGETTEIVTGRASINMSGLTTDTEYEVEASLTSDFTVTVSDTFRTLPPDPVVSSVNVSSIRQTTATADIDIANSNGTEQTVHLSYRTTTPRGDWSNIQTTTSTTDSASIDLSGLTPGTEYDVQASLDGSFPTTRTKYAIFTTLRYPSIASVEAENIGRNGATVSATIADSHGAVQTVYVRHSKTQFTAWRPTQQADSVDDIASLRLRGLSSGTEYIAEASLDDSFPSDETRSVTFTTKKRDDDDSDVAVSTARAVNVPLPGFSPLMLRFTAIEGGDNPAPQSFSVWNRAQGPMDFSLSNHEEWLSLQPLSGMSGGPAEPVNITASVDSSELAAGQYVDVINIKVSSSGRTPGQIVVVLDVVPPDYVRQFVSRDEGGVVVLPDGTVKIVVAPLAPPKDVDIELMKLNLLAHGVPPGEQERVIVAIESNTYPPGGDTPEDVAYSPSVELWVMLPKSEANACAEGKIRLYSVQSGDWSLVEHRCETDEASNVWAVSEIERLGAFALVIDDSPAPTAAAAPASTPVSAVRLVSPALPVQRVSLPAVAPTPVPTAVPTPLPILNGRPAATPVAAEVSASTTPELAVSERSVPAMQASVETQGSGGFNGLILGALGLPLLIGGGIVVLLFYRERRRNGEQLQ